MTTETEEKEITNKKVNKKGKTGRETERIKEIIDEKWVRPEVRLNDIQQDRKREITDESE